LKTLSRFPSFRIAVLVVTAGLMFCSNAIDAAVEAPEWTVMVYLNAKNNLERDGFRASTRWRARAALKL
jgi:hypothetical protein